MTRTAGFGEPGDSNCKACNAPIVWVGTKKGRTMPVDAASNPDNDPMYQHGKHVSHFATCPAAASFRKPANASES